VIQHHFSSYGDERKGVACCDSASFSGAMAMNGRALLLVIQHHFQELWR
jgi:hypothetical protein